LDGRSDIYSLGILLYESLAGQLPVADLDAARRDLRKANPQVSQGLEDIVSKCLAVSPKARYQDAGQLAGDLRCHVARLPLRGVANRSVVERWQKWRRRKPHAMPVVAAGLAAVLMIGGIGGLFYRDRIRTAEAFLVQSQRELLGKEYAPAIEHAQTAWNSLHWFPLEVNLRGRLQTQIESAQQAQTIASLHDFVEQLRFLDNEQLSDTKLAEIAAGCNKIWDARTRFAPGMTEDPQDQSETALDEPLRRDFLDLAILSARLDVQLANSEDKSKTDKIAGARHQALQKLNEAQQMCGSSILLDLARRDYQETSPNSVGDIRLNSLAPSGNAWEHYAIGRWLMHHGDLIEAQRQLALAVDLEPNEFWANFEQTRCDFELGHFDQAVTAATVCIALAPQQAACFFNRAICFQSLGRDDDALDDLSRALQLDPALAPAALARGILWGRLQRYAESKADLESALAHGSRPSDVYYQLARLSLAQHDHSAATNWVQKSLTADPNNATSIALQKELATSAP
jgi:tetratricopeptide (TPR) repeat protein